MKQTQQIKKQTEKPPNVPPHVCESDGMVYTSYPPQYRCRICGKFSYIHKGEIRPQLPDYMK